MNKRRPSVILEAKYSDAGSCCFYCQKSIPFEDITRDHLYPVSKGGTLNNSVFSCYECNVIKSDSSFEELNSSLTDRLLKMLISYKNKPNDKKLDKIIYYSRIIKTISGFLVSNIEESK